MTSPLDSRNVRRLPFGSVELDWWKLPWLNVADRDAPWTKKASIDLDPAGGAFDTVTISIGNLPSQYVVVEDIDIRPADTFSIQNSRVRTRIDDTPLNRWSQIEQTAFVPASIDAELWHDRLFVIPEGRTLNVDFTNLSPLGRARFDVDIRGWIARLAN